MPPAGSGEGVGCAPLSGRWGGRQGDFSESAEGGVDREDSIPTGRWQRPRGPRRRVAAVGRDGVSLSIPRADGLDTCGPRGFDPYREVAAAPSVRRRLFFPRGRIIVVEHISPYRPPTWALCGVPTERHPSSHPYPGLHPGLVCRAPLGHPLELSTAVSRSVEAIPMDRRRPHPGLVGQRFGIFITSIARSEGTEHITRSPTDAGPMRRSYRTPSFLTPIPGVAPRAGMPCPVGAPT